MINAGEATSLQTSLNQKVKPSELWASINWSKEYKKVQKLRERIFAASQVGNKSQVRNLQKLALRNFSVILVATKKVTEDSLKQYESTTLSTPGSVYEARWKMAQRILKDIQQGKTLQGRKTSRHSKASLHADSLGERNLRIYNKILQLVVMTALEAEWESKFKGGSYGARPGRSIYDAVEALWLTTKGPAPRRRWILVGNVSVMDRKLLESSLVEKLDAFPARGAIKDWLKEGLLEQSLLVRSDTGALLDKGLAPLLFNILMNDMEGIVGVKSGRSKNPASYKAHKPDSPVVVTHVDDFVVVEQTKEAIEDSVEKIKAWLSTAGLSLQEKDCSIHSLEDGFDFLGFNVRHYRHVKKNFVTPSKYAIKDFKARVRRIFRKHRASQMTLLLNELNPLVKSWGAHYRHVVSSEVSHDLDSYMFILSWRWAKRRHPKKTGKWVSKKYFGRFNKSKYDNWVFGDSATGLYLSKIFWIKIARHPKVFSINSPCDPSLHEYWSDRWTKRQDATLNKAKSLMAAKQNQRCFVCNCHLLNEYTPPSSQEEWKRWVALSTKGLQVHHYQVFQRHGGNDSVKNLALVHSNCHKQYHTTSSHGLAGPPELLGATEKSEYLRGH